MLRHHIPPIALLLAASALPAAGAGLEEAKVVLHVQQLSKIEQCTSAAPTSTPCSQFTTRGTVGVLYNVYVLVANATPTTLDGGVAGVSLGIDYDHRESFGVDVYDWTRCVDMEFPDFIWPDAGGSNVITWDTDGNCQDGLVPGYEDEGIHAVAGFFRAAAHSADLMSITSNRNTGNLAVTSCDAASAVLPLTSAGAARFTPSGDVPGFNPCPGSSDPPPPPPTPVSAALALHIGSGEPIYQGCDYAPASAEEVVTSAPYGVGYLSYFVYILGVPEAPAPEGFPSGLTGMRFAIEYDEDTGAGDGIAVWSWTLCSAIQSPEPGWPHSGSGNTLTWAVEDCQTRKLVPGGYFYLTPYAPAVMTIVPQTSGELSVADCSGQDIPLNPSQTGWISLGMASQYGIDVGCNPALTPCEGPVATLGTTWGKIKGKY